MSIWLRRSLSLVLILPLLHSAWAVDRSKDLSPRYRHWINEEVAYIISSGERKQFLSLHTDAERDNFIRAFWADRNPNGASDINPYKEEHYKRLAYANEHFGHAGTGDGWQSDQGRIYITLGPPQQKADYELARNVRPMQIWFYQSPTPALPLHFYIVFYKPSQAEDWQLYSPTFDTPTKLVSTMRGMNDPQRSLAMVRSSLGDEVARTVVSLIPTSPVDLSSYSPDLESDALLGSIESLADNPITLRQLAERRATNVTSTIFYGGNEPDLETAVFRGDGGRLIASYLLRMPHPDASLIGSLPGGHFGYHLTLHTQVLTPTGTQVYDEEHEFKATLDEAAVRNAQSKIFGAEGRLPLAPGRYRIVSTLTNDLNHSGYRQQAELVVPPATDAPWGISTPVAFSPQPPLHVSQFDLPFTMEGIRFVPIGVKSAFLHQGETLRLAFQLWTNPASVASLAQAAVHVHYAWGSVGAGVPQQESEDLQGSSFDAAGNLLTGHTIPTSALGPGNYRLVITADDAAGHKAYTSIVFHIVDDSTPTDMWTVYDTPRSGQQSAAQDDYRRGLSAVASGDHPTAARCFQSALDEDPADPRIFSALVAALAASQQQSRLATLAQRLTPTRQLDLHTAVLMARASAGQGNPKRALQILEFELQFQPPSAELYQALADTYAQLGQTAKSREFRDRLSKL